MEAINVFLKYKWNDIDFYIPFTNLAPEKKHPGENCHIHSDCANNYCMPVEVNGLSTKECV